MTAEPLPIALIAMNYFGRHRLCVQRPHTLVVFLAFALAFVTRGASMLFHIRFGVMGELIFTVGR
jgi:hypothetical protein